MARPRNKKISVLSLSDLSKFGAEGTTAHIDSVSAHVAIGHAETHGEPDENGLIAVRITEEGISSMNVSDTAPASASAMSEVVAMAEADFAGLAAPTKRRNGRTSQYPFHSLEIGHVFFVADREDARAATFMRSALINAEARFAEPTGNMISTVKKTYQKDADGNFILDADGHRVADRETIEVPETKKTREFTMIEIADGAPFRHPGVAGVAIRRKA